MSSAIPQIRCLHIYALRINSSIPVHQRTNELDIEYILVFQKNVVKGETTSQNHSEYIQAYSKDILRFRCSLIFLSYVYNKTFIGLDNEKHDGCYIRNRNFILLNIRVHPRLFGEAYAVHHFSFVFFYFVLFLVLPVSLDCPFLIAPSVSSLV